MPVKDFVNRHASRSTLADRTNSPQPKPSLRVDDLKVAPPAEPSLLHQEKTRDGDDSRRQSQYTTHLAVLTQHRDDPNGLFGTDSSTIDNDTTDLDQLPDFVNPRPSHENQFQQTGRNLRDQASYVGRTSHETTPGQNQQGQMSPNLGNFTRGHLTRFVEGDSYPSTTSAAHSEAEIQPPIPSGLNQRSEPIPGSVLAFKMPPRRSIVKGSQPNQPTNADRMYGHSTSTLRDRPTNLRVAGQGSRQTLSQYRQQRSDDMRQSNPVEAQREDVPHVDVLNGNSGSSVDAREDGNLSHIGHNTTTAAHDVDDSAQRRVPSGGSGKLDYESATLYAMTFDELKRKPFDEDPALARPQFPSRFSRMTLSERLQDMLGLAAEDQDPFFASLSREQWEEAGDWFIDKFGEILASLKALRGEKRDLLSSFEGEIEQRHQAVEQARTEIKEDLEGMKERGPMILQSSPRKPSTPAR